jgi:hypothetical protein
MKASSPSSPAGLLLWLGALLKTRSILIGKPGRSLMEFPVDP